MAETINLDALRAEKKALEIQLAEKEPSEEELVELGKTRHPHYQFDSNVIKKRVDEIDFLLTYGN